MADAKMLQTVVTVSYIIAFLLFILITKLQSINATLRKNANRKEERLINIDDGEKLLKFLNGYCTHISIMEFKYYCMTHDLSKISLHSVKQDLVQTTCVKCKEYLVEVSENDKTSYAISDSGIFTSQFIDQYIIRSVMLGLEELITGYLNEEGEDLNT